MNNRKRYLGYVERVAADGERTPAAGLSPQYIYDERHGVLAWYPLTDEEVKQQFPNRGLITWWNPPRDATKGSAWHFNIEEQYYEHDKPWHDAFRAAPTPLQLDEVLDLRIFENEGRARLELTQQGTLLYFTPSEHIFLWINDQTWIGPVHLTALPQHDKWIIDPAQQIQPLQVFLPPPVKDIVQFRIEEPRLNVKEAKLFLVPDAKIGKRLGQVDWAPDEIVLKRVLFWLRQTDPGYTDTLGLTQKAIERAVGQLDLRNPARIDVMLETQRLRRACDIMEQLNKRQELVAEVVANLLQVPSIADGIKDATAAAQQEAITQVRAETTVHVADLSAQAKALEETSTRLDQEISNKRTELATIEDTITKQRAMLADQVDMLDTTLAERLSEIMTRPEQELADIAILRAALGLSATSNRKSPLTEVAHNREVRKTFQPVLPMWISRGTKPDALNQLEDLRRALRKAFQIRSVPLKAAQSLHAAFLTGAMPVLAGSNALEALEAYAWCIAGERWLWLPIPPTILEPSDLIGNLDPETQRYLSYPGGLLDLLLHAHNTNDLYLVVLDGINRTAVDNYLAPILACYTDIWRGRQTRALPLSHNYTFGDDDTCTSITQLVWPPNVLLAGTLTEGVATIPPSSAFWSNATLIHIDQFDENFVQTANLEPIPTEASSSTSVTLETWTQWRQQIQVADLATCIEFLNSVLEEGLLLRSEIRALCLRLYAALQTWGLGESAGLEEVIIQCLVPLSVTSRQKNLLLEALNSTQRITERTETAIRLTEQVVS